jgi:benzoylformate decarboxylase
MGMLGFALPAAIGLRMAQPERPVLTVVGDGSSLYQIQSVWSAARYGAGVLFIVLANGGYAIMDRLAERNGGPGPWPQIEGVDICSIARGFGCDAVRVDTHEALIDRLDAELATLAERTAPLLLEVVVAQDETFDP